MTDETTDTIPPMPMDAVIGDPDRPMSAAQAAAWLNLPAFGYDVNTLLRWVEAHRIECIHIGKKPAFLREQLVRFARHGMPEDSAIGKLKRITR